MEGLMPALLAMKGGKSAFDHARAEAQATGRQQGLRLTQVGKQALVQAGPLARCDDGELIAGGVQHMQRMGQTEAIGIEVGLQSRLMHPGAYRVMSQQQPIEFLIKQLWRLAAQGLRAETLMGFEFIDH